MNVRWLVPVYHATLYTVQHAYHEEAGCEKVSSEDCMTCLQAFASLCALDGGVKSRVRSQHNPFVSVDLEIGGPHPRLLDAAARPRARPGWRRASASCDGASATGWTGGSGSCSGHSGGV